SVERPGGNHDGVAAQHGFELGRGAHPRGLRCRAEWNCDLAPASDQIDSIVMACSLHPSIALRSKDRPRASSGFGGFSKTREAAILRSLRLSFRTGIPSRRDALCCFLGGERSGLLGRDACDDGRARLEGAVHGALPGDLRDLRREPSVHLALNLNDALETIDLAAASLRGLAAIRAMIGSDLAVAHFHRYTAERELLVLGIEAQCHCRAGSKRDRQIVIGVGASVEAADSSWLVGDEPVAAGEDEVLEFSFTRFADHDVLSLRNSCRSLRHVSCCPRRDDAGG